MPTDPDELLAHHDPGEPWLQWGCALCDHRAVLPEEFEAHTAAAHPGWVARYEAAMWCQVGFARRLGVG